MTAKSEHIVTEDKDLLRLSNYGDARILTIRDFIDQALASALRAETSGQAACFARPACPKIATPLRAGFDQPLTQEARNAVRYSGFALRKDCRTRTSSSSSRNPLLANGIFPPS
jgi:hypothetical protein